MLGVAVARQTCRKGVALLSALHSAHPQNFYKFRPVFTSAVLLLPKDHLQRAAKSSKDVENYQMIYKFPYIVVARAVCRLKLYQTAICGIAVPAVGYYAHNGVLSMEAFAATAAVGGLAFVMLFVMGEIFRRTVGHIYYSAKDDIVKVSHLSFWGGRKDIVIPLNDLVPITDTSDVPTDIYVHLLRYSKPKDSLYLFLRFGGITDIEKFTHVLGLLRPEEQISDQEKE